MSNIKPILYIIGIENHYAAEVLYWWNYYLKPCNLLFIKPKTPGLTAIKVLVDNYETTQFILKVKERTKCQIVKKELP